MLVALFLEMNFSFAAADGWKSTGPTAQDIAAATKVENLVVKGSWEDKLINAVKKGDLKNVEMAIAAGANLEARDNQNMTPLLRAAEKGYSDIARILIDAGADIGAQDNFSCTPFFYAVDKNHVDFTKMLIAHQGEDSNFEDLFVSAAFRGRTEMVKALIQSDSMKSKILEQALQVVRARSEIYNIIVEALNKRS